MDIKQKLFNIEQEPDAGGKMRFLMTSAALDRDGEVVDPDGMKAEAFMANPVFLYGHDSYAPPMGIITQLNRTDKGWEAEVEWADAINPFAAMIKAYYEAGFMRAVSIRFMPKKWVTGSMDEDGYGLKFTEWELLELSAVTIPANPEALRVRSAGEGPVRQWLKGLQAAMDQPENKAESADAPANAPAPGDGEKNAGASISSATEVKIGSELSAKNRKRLASIKDALKSCHDDLNGLLAKWADGCDRPDDDDDDDDDEDEGKGLTVNGTDAPAPMDVEAEAAKGTPAAEAGEKSKTDDGGITLDNLVGADDEPEGITMTEQELVETVARQVAEVLAEREASQKQLDEEYLSGMAAIRDLLA